MVSETNHSSQNRLIVHTAMDDQSTQPVRENSLRVIYRHTLVGFDDRFLVVSSSERFDYVL